MRVGDCFEGISDLPGNQSHCRRCEFLSNKEWGDLTDLPRMQPRNLKWQSWTCGRKPWFLLRPWSYSCYLSLLLSILITTLKKMEKVQLYHEVLIQILPSSLFPRPAWWANDSPVFPTWTAAFETLSSLTLACKTRWVSHSQKDWRVKHHCITTLVNLTFLSFWRVTIW